MKVEMNTYDNILIVDALRKERNHLENSVMRSTKEHKRKLATIQEIDAIDKLIERLAKLVNF